jgi:hypothetical protein
VIQEFAVSPTAVFHCGNDSFSFDAYRLVVGVLVDAPQLVMSEVRLYKAITVATYSLRLRDSFHTNTPKSLGEILSSTYGGFESTNVRDKVFALLGLVSGQSIQKPKADYVRAIFSICLSII